LSSSSTIPPCECTIPLGAPVVPEDHSTHSGSANAVSAYSGSASVRTASPQATAGTGRSHTAGTDRLSTVSTVRTDGSPATSSATVSRRSYGLPPNR
jgi:hypothetical protein